MGPINWLAVVLSATLAFALGLVWYGPLFGGASLFGRVAGHQSQQRGPIITIIGAVALQGIAALMLAHNFARIGPGVLADRPWLYWMQAGGVAMAFIAPALWISYARHRLPAREALVDSGFWLAVYLATGTVFWALG